MDREPCRAVAYIPLTVMAVPASILTVRVNILFHVLRIVVSVARNKLSY